MFAYIFIKATNKYFIVPGDDITDFWYETPGRQSKQFASKPFKYIGKKTDSNKICQILIVAPSEEEVQNLVDEKRYNVPKLNNSDLQLSPTVNENILEKEKTKRIRSDLKNNVKSSAVMMNKIIAAHLSKNRTADTKQTLLKGKKLVDKSNSLSKDNNASDDDDTETVSNSSKDSETSEALNKEELVHLNKENSGSAAPNDYDDDYELPEEMRDTFTNEESTRAQQRDRHESAKQNNPRNNHMDVDIIAENELLKTKLLRLKAINADNNRANKLLQKKCKDYQDIIHNKNKGPKELELKLNPKGIPLPICTNSGILVRTDAIEDAYNKVKPSMFYESLCYATWGRMTLAERCVKKTKKTPAGCKVLTPRKKRAIRKHFIHYLKYYKYHSILFNKEMNSINTYAHRAIISSKNHAKLVNKYKELASDEEEEDSIDRIEL